MKLLLVLCLMLSIAGCANDQSESKEIRAGESMNSAIGSHISLVFRLGEPIRDREVAWAGHIDFASWMDDELIVYSSRGDVTSPRKLSVSPNGLRAALIADDEVMCVRDRVENRDVFFQGKRIKEKPDSLTGSIDTPFFSHLRDSGGDDLIYAMDNSWAPVRFSFTTSGQ
jgi:hypothetical protein